MEQLGNSQGYKGHDIGFKFGENPVEGKTIIIKMQQSTKEEFIISCIRGLRGRS